MRVMVVNQSDQLRQMLQYVFENGINVEVVAETDELEALPQTVRQVKPDWLFLLQDEYSRLTGVIEELLRIQPDLQVILLSADGQHIQFQKPNGWQTEVDRWQEYTLSDFIYFLSTENLSQTSTKSIADVGNVQKG